MPANPNTVSSAGSSSTPGTSRRITLPEGFLCSFINLPDSRRGANHCSRLDQNPRRKYGHPSCDHKHLHFAAFAEGFSILTAGKDERSTP